MRLAYYAEDDRPGPSEIVAPGHTNLDLGATGAPITGASKSAASVRNLLNEEYYASPDPRFVFAPGINGFMSFVSSTRGARPSFVGPRRPAA